MTFIYFACFLRRIWLKNLYEEFEDCKREDGQSISEFISKFDTRYKKVAKLELKLPSPILAFMLLKKANITKSERMRVMTGMDYASVILYMSRRKAHCCTVAPPCGSVEELKNL